MLTDFYIQMALYLETGINPHGFSIGYGLCTNLELYCRSTKSSISDFTSELLTQFTKNELAEVYPFNSSPYQLTYAAESYLGKLYENEKRLDWIKKHATPVQTLPSTN